MIVDFVSDVGIQIPQWIVRQCSQMQHGIESLQIGEFDFANIFADGANFRRWLAKGTVAIQVAIQADDFVTFRLQHGNQYGSDVSFIAGDEYSHCSTQI